MMSSFIISQVMKDHNITAFPISPFTRNWLGNKQIMRHKMLYYLCQSYSFPCRCLFPCPLTSQVMKDHSITALPISSPPGKWLGVGGSNIVDECRQYIVSVTHNRHFVSETMSILQCMTKVSVGFARSSNIVDECRQYIVSERRNVNS